MNALQIDDLREQRQDWREWLERRRDREAWCYEDTLEWDPYTSWPAGTETDLMDARQ